MVVSSVALAASLVRGVSGVVGMTIAIILAMALLEGPPLALSLLPSSLAGSTGALSRKLLGSRFFRLVDIVVCGYREPGDDGRDRSTCPGRGLLDS